MKLLSRLSLILLSFFVVFPNALAAGKVPSQYQEKHYFGVIYGEADGGLELGQSTATGFMLSARNEKAALEYVYLRTDTGNISPSNGIWEMDTQGIYYAVQGEGQSYMKLKLGRILQEMLRDDDGDGVIESTEEYAYSYGVGFGYKFSGGNILELEYTTLDEDLSYVTLSFLF